MSSIAPLGKLGLGEDKNSGFAMSLMVVKFQEAVRKDEFSQAWALLLKYPETETWPVNPLHIAIEHRNLRLAIEIGRGWPKLMTIANQDGDRTMHLASDKGDVKIVEFLGKLHPGSCLVENKSSMIPLQIAVVKGHHEVIKKLISLCPESLGKLTSKQQTVFHLAIENSQGGVFQVLLEEAMKLNQGHLLYKKDDEGNTVLQIAEFKGLTEIVELLTIDSSSSSSSQIEMQVINSNNDEVYSTETMQYSSRVVNRETTHVLLVVLGMIAAATFAVPYNLPDALLNEIYLSVSGRLPTVVYLLVFNSAGFFTSMLVISYLMWPLALRSILFFVLVCTCIVYITTVNKITPEFSVSVVNFSFSSISLVWTSALAFIVIGLTIIGMGKYTMKCFRWFLQPDY